MFVCALMRTVVLNIRTSPAESRSHAEFKLSHTHTHLIDHGGVAMEKRPVADVRVPDDPTQIRRSPPDLRKGHDSINGIIQEEMESCMQTKEAGKYYIPNMYPQLAFKGTEVTYNESVQLVKYECWWLAS